MFNPTETVRSVAKYPNGYEKSIIIEEYDGKNFYRHNVTGPAVQRFFENGIEHTREYYVKGKLHRTSGPAFTEWDEEGNIITELYYINGEIVELEMFTNVGLDIETDFSSSVVRNFIIYANRFNII